MGYFSHTLIATTLALHHEIVCHTRILFFFALFFVSFLYVFFFYPNGSFKWFFFMQILAKWFIPLQRFSNGKNCNDLIVAEKYNQWTWINKRKIMYICTFINWRQICPWVYDSFHISRCVSRSNNRRSCNFYVVIFPFPLYSSIYGMVNIC